jgi:hypothetical protein
MSHLAVQVQNYLAQPGITATAIENRAQLKRGTLDSIQRDQHPRPERLGQLLRALDDATARQWLTAYLRDDCPPEFLDRLEIIIRATCEGTTVQDAAASYGTSPQIDGPAAVLHAWQRLHAATLKDASLGRWFIKTINLILGVEQH